MQSAQSRKETGSCWGRTRQTTAIMKMGVFRSVAPCFQVEMYRRFEDIIIRTLIVEAATTSETSVNQTSATFSCWWICLGKAKWGRHEPLPNLWNRYHSHYNSGYWFEAFRFATSTYWPTPSLLQVWIWPSDSTAQCSRAAAPLPVADRNFKGSRHLSQWAVDRSTNDSQFQKTTYFSKGAFFSTLPSTAVQFLLKFILRRSLNLKIQ